MKLNNSMEVKLFAKAVRKCRKSVWVMTCDGKSIDLKTELGFLEGTAELLRPCKAWQEPELFTNSEQDYEILNTFFETRLTA